jgi:hypothetical protein
VAWPWCLRPLCQFFKSPPSPNKLKASFPPDLDLEDLAGSSYFPSLRQARSSTSLLVGRGGEGMGSRSGPACLVKAGAEDPEVVRSPRYVTSPARGPVLSAYLVSAVWASAAATCVSPPTEGRLLCADLLRPPSPARGRCSELMAGRLSPTVAAKFLPLIAPCSSPGDGHVSARAPPQRRAIAVYLQRPVHGPCKRR